MIFSSIEFIIFFSIFALSIIIFPKFQRFNIISFSFVFYSFWEPLFSLIIVYLILISYFSFRKDYKLKISIPLLLAPLIYFKYSSFIFEVFAIKGLGFLNYSAGLPLGISFITFTAIALLVDIKKKVFLGKL